MFQSRTFANTRSAGLLFLETSSQLFYRHTCNDPDFETGGLS